MIFYVYSLLFTELVRMGLKFLYFFIRFFVFYERKNLLKQFYLFISIWHNGWQIDILYKITSEKDFTVFFLC